MKKISVLCLLLLPFILTAQFIKGSVMDANLNGFPKAVVKIKNKSTRTDGKGEFIIRVDGKFPHYLTFSAPGYESEIIRVDTEGEEVSIVMKEIKRSEVMVQSASRTAEKELESPVTVGRLSISEIERASSNSFYEEIELLKGVSKLEGGFNFQSLNARGFASFNNSRFIQFVDGCDNTLPALNYFQGNVNGVSELDVVGVEIVHGAASALYGSNAYNGIILLNTKNPFEHPGISIQLKSGVSSQKESGIKPFYETSLRYGHQFNSYFAAKLNYTYRDAEEWRSNDLRGINDVGIGEVIESSIDNLDYNGLNFYGDELAEGILEFDKKASKIRRTGYHERDLIEDFRNKNTKISTSLHFRFLGDSYPLELQLGVRHAKSNSIDTFGESKLVKRDFVYNQFNTELKGPDFYIRAYKTQNDAGKTYDLGNTAYYLNKKVDNKNKIDGIPSFATRVDTYLRDKYEVDLNGDWYKAYDVKIDDYKEAKQYAYNTGNNFDVKSEEFKKALKDITYFHENGSRIYDKSSLVHLEGNYNFKWLLYDWCDFQAGGSYREYTTDTKGTILNDLNDNIKVSEFGVFSQFQKSIFDERLKITSSLRYDKSKNFKGHFSPRFALNYIMGKDRNHVIRASYQNAFRNPSIREQYLNRYESGSRTIGFVDENLAKISIQNEDYKNLKGDISEISGDEIVNYSVVSEKLDGSKSVFEKNRYKALRNESVTSLELGYRSLINITYSTRIDLDFDAFYSKNKHFIHKQRIAVSKTGLFFPNGENKISKEEKNDLVEEIKTYKDNIDNSFDLNVDDLIREGVQVMDIDAYIDLMKGNEEEINLLVNSNTEIISYGFGLSLSTKINDMYDVGVNYSYINFDTSKFRENFQDYGFYMPGFNTPKHTFKFYVGADAILYDFGFKLNVVTQDKYQWVSSVVSEIPSKVLVNAHVNYMMPSINSMIKLGSTNLIGKEYEVAPGLGNIGRTYYLSLFFEN